MAKRKQRITDTVAELHNGGGLATIAIFLGGGEAAANYYENRGQRELENSKELPTKIGGHGGPDHVEVYAKMGIQVLREKSGDAMFCEAVLPQGWKVERTDHYMWSHLLDDKGCKRAQIFYKADPWDRDAFLSLNRRFNIDFHQYLPEDKKYIKKTIMVEEPVPGQLCGDSDRWYDVRHPDGYYREYRKRSIRMVPKEVTENRYANIYEETKVTPYWTEVKDHDGKVLFTTKKKYFKTPYPVIHKVNKRDTWTEGEQAAHYEWWKQHEEFEELQRSIGRLWLDQHYPNWQDFHAYWNIEISK